MKLTLGDKAPYVHLNPSVLHYADSKLKIKFCQLFGQAFNLFVYRKDNKYYDHLVPMIAS